MSSATPAAFWSAMSMTTTSASCLSAMPRATVAPTFPAPPTTVTLRFIVAPGHERGTQKPRRPLRTLSRRILVCVLCGLCVPSALHVFDDGVTEFRGLQLRRALHQAREVVGHASGGDRAVHSLDHQIGGLVPAKMAQHHFAGQNDRAGVDLVEVRVFRRGAVRGFEYGVAGHIIDVAPGSDADAADLCRQRVR